MRKIILNLAVSLDGFIEGPNGEYDWCLADQDYGMTAFFEQIDTMFIGRKSYEMISADTHLFPLKKICVFSDTIRAAQPENVEVVRSATFDEQVQRLINEEGENIWLFGGAGLVSTLLNKNLVSEIILSIHPVILGEGKPLFKNMKDRVNLELLDQQSFSSGLLQARYVVKPRFDAEMMKLL